MLTETVRHGDLEFVVSEATNAMGARRIRLLQDAIKFSRENPDSELAGQYFSFPAVSAALVGTNHCLALPLRLDDFLSLSEEATQKLHDAIERLNPHWYRDPEPDSAQDEIKKAT